MNKLDHFHLKLMIKKVSVMLLCLTTFSVRMTASISTSSLGHPLPQPHMQLMTTSHFLGNRNSQEMETSSESLPTYLHLPLSIKAISSSCSLDPFPFQVLG